MSEFRTFNILSGEQRTVTGWEMPFVTDRGFTDEQWAAFCAHHGQDPDDPDAFCVTPPNRLRRMMAEFLAL